MTSPTQIFWTLPIWSLPVDLPPLFNKYETILWMERREGEKIIPEHLMPLPDDEVAKHARWPTAFYAAFASLVSFTFFGKGASELEPVMTCFLIFLPLTSSVMMFNDLIDRAHDLKKGRWAAHKHPYKFAGVVIQPAFYTIVIANPLIQHYPTLGMYVVGVWIISLLYSFTRRLLIFQNVIVAAASAAPLLCGSILHSTFHPEALRVATAVFVIILSREIVKDIEDCEVDKGWKKTIPLCWGKPVATVVLMALLWIPLVALTHSNLLLIQLSAFSLVPLLPLYVSMLLKPERLAWTKAWMDLSLVAILAASFFASLQE